VVRKEQEKVMAGDLGLVVQYHAMTQKKGLERESDRKGPGSMGEIVRLWIV
jgi:hypothetical protein